MYIKCTVNVYFDRSCHCVYTFKRCYSTPWFEPTLPILILPHFPFRNSVLCECHLCSRVFNKCCYLVDAIEVRLNGIINLVVLMN